MKKIIFLLLILIPFRVYASIDSAYSYILMDMDNNNVIMSKNKDKPMLIASITKIMTCIIAIENSNLSDIVVVDDVIKSSYGSGIYISIGEEIKLEDLLYGLMLRSGNDAALVIAKYVAGDIDSFVKMMNDKAKELGMKNTIFYNPSGLDNDVGNKSTVYDMGLLTGYAMKNNKYREIVGTKKYSLKTNMKSYIWYNKNKLLKYSYITGGKTGYTEKAKRTLVSTASKDNMNFVVVTIKDSDDWNTHIDLYDYAFSNYYNTLVVRKNGYKVLGDKIYDNLYIKEDIRITINKDDNKNLVNYIELFNNKEYKSGDIVGYNNIYLDNKLIYKGEIYAKKKKDISLLDRIKRFIYG